MAYSETYSQGPCPACGSDDSFTTREVTQMQGLRIETRRRYCNPCPYQERWVRVEGMEVFHDVSDGNTMRVVLPERR